MTRTDQPLVPTPPSDAGTSERETGRCARPGCDYARELHPVDDGDTYCPEFVPAAPAAEGPRADWKCTNIRSHFADEWMCGTLNGADEESCGACGADRPVAALPVAEAGTPETTAFPDDAEWLVYLDRFVEQTNPQSLPRSIHDRLRAVAAALTSEVRALREDKARLDWMDEHTAGVEVADNEVGTLTVQSNLDYRQVGGGEAIRDAIDAARLASPSPTGAP